MTIRLMIHCDNPTSKRANSSDHSTLRCLSDTKEEPFMIVHGMPHRPEKTLEDLLRLAGAQSWTIDEGSLFCPGCSRHLQLR